MTKILLFILAITFSLPGFAQKKMSEAMRIIHNECDNKKEAVSCFKLAEIYKRKRKAIQFRKYLELSCELKYQKACEEINGKPPQIKAPKVSPFGKFVSFFKTCKEYKYEDELLGTLYTYKMQPIKTGCYLSYTTKSKTIECLFSDINRKKVLMNSGSFLQLNNQMRKYIELDVCQELEE